MSRVQGLSLKNIAAAAVFSLAGFVWTGPAALHSMFSSQAYAAGTLTPSQVASINSDLAAKMSAINAQSFPNEAAKQAAIAAAIAQVTENAIAAGADPGAVASAVIAAADDMNLVSSTVGTGLGAAAASVSEDDGKAIAQVVKDQGSTAMNSAFTTSVADNGGSQDIVNVALGTPNLFNGDNGVNNDGDGNPPPACDNPSCS